ncbi:DUF2470 domain-containing protein [Dactylosporangium sp. CA-052675]|uniref:DUF2470 domain-containing protein n=1 Tax=Dactylosporangium sp. CA-052675 TaxID=3239927 RepID=UPI003D8DC61F
MSTFPTPAERLRSLLAAAGSLTLHVPGRRCDLVGAHRVEGGRILLDVPPDAFAAYDSAAALAADDSAAALAADDSAAALQVDDSAAVLELTDVAPTSVRSRVRARATFGGWLGVHPAGGLALDLAEATLQDPAYGRDAEITVDPDEFAAAEPDPLAHVEADLLCHLSDAHPDAVDRLARLVPPHHLHGVKRVVPVRLDRYGVVLRLEFAGRARDVRLPFPTPLNRPEEAGDRMRELYALARCCPGGH